MNINISKEKNIELTFSWKEIWILIKKRKFIFNEELFNIFLSSLLKSKIKIEEMKKEENEI